MDELEYFVDEKVIGPFILKNEGEKVKLICTITTRWEQIKACSLSCGKKTEFSFTRSTGVRLVERDDLETSIMGSLGLKGVAELKSEVKSKTGIELQLEERREEQEKFYLDSPNCMRVTYRIYQLIRVYLFSYRDNRSALWRQKSYDKPITEETRHIYVGQTLPKVDPSCGCTDKPEQNKGGLVGLFLGAMGLTAYYVQTQGRVKFPTLNLSFKANSVQELFGQTYILDVEQFSPLLRTLAGTDLGKVQVRFVLHKEQESSISLESQQPDLVGIARQAVAEKYGWAEDNPGTLTPAKIRKLKNLNDLYFHELRSLYKSELQAVNVWPRIIQKVTQSNLKSILEEHLKETQQHIYRLEQIFETHEKFPGGKDKFTNYLLEEILESMNNDVSHDNLNMHIISSIRRLKHYEISGYNTVCHFAKGLGRTEDFRLLSETLNEEKLTDEKLEQLTQEIIKLRFGYSG